MFWLIVFNATFNNISAISWRSVFVYIYMCISVQRQFSSFYNDFMNIAFVSLYEFRVEFWNCSDSAYFFFILFMWHNIYGEPNLLVYSIHAEGVGTTGAGNNNRTKGPKSLYYHRPMICYRPLCSVHLIYFNFRPCVKNPFFFVWY